MLERRLEEIEEGSFTAVPLCEVISCDKAGDESTIIQEVGSNIRIRKSPKSISDPHTTEEFRSRIKTLAISYIIAAYKHTSRLWLRTATHSVWTKYVEWILSNEIGLYATDTDGLSIRSSWSNVLIYEYQIRKLLCRKVLYESKDFETALEESRLDLSLKERYFITPTAMAAAASRGGGKAAALNALTKGGGKGNEKGLSKKQRKAEKRAAGVPESEIAPKAAKGNAKGKDRRSKSRMTPDGRIVCTAFNTLVGCTYAASCKFVHCCSKCYDASHTAMTCTNR